MVLTQHMYGIGDTVEMQQCCIGDTVARGDTVAMRDDFMIDKEKWNTGSVTAVSPKLLVRSTLWAASHPGCEWNQVRMVESRDSWIDAWACIQCQTSWTSVMPRTAVALATGGCNPRCEGDRALQKPHCICRKQVRLHGLPRVSPSD